MIWDERQHQDNGPAVLIGSGLSELCFNMELINEKKNAHNSLNHIFQQLILKVQNIRDVFHGARWWGESRQKQLSLIDSPHWVHTDYMEMSLWWIVNL